MKTRAIIFAALLASSIPAYCQDEPTIGDYLLDAAFYRPFGFIQTVVGGGAFMATLPVSLTASAITFDNYVFEAGKEFVFEPASSTFSRPLGMSLTEWHRKFWAEKRAGR